MALGLLLILFMVMSIISVVGLLLLFLLKGERAQKIVFYFMALLGMFIAWMTATGYATNQIKEQMISWGFGALAVVAVLVRLCGKSKNAALGKATGGGICGARHGGIIYRLKKIKISLEKERRRRLPAPFFCGKICQVLSVEIFLWMKYNRINCKICVKSAGNSAVFFGCGRVYFC